MKDVRHVSLYRVLRDARVEVERTQYRIYLTVQGRLYAPVRLVVEEMLIRLIRRTNSK